MKIVVTGGNGYIGKALKNRIETMEGVSGSFITIDSEEGFPHTDFSVEDLAEHFRGADVVIHLAAVRGGNSITQLDVNSKITENVMLALDAAGVRRFVFMSSIAVYSDTDNLPWREDQPCAPVSLYGISKLACEGLCRYYAKKNGTDGVILRLAPVYGENDRNKRMIANFVRQALEGVPLEVRGKSLAQRDFIYLDDVVSALLFAIRQTNKGVNIINIGSGEKLTNYDIASHIVSAAGRPDLLVYDDTFPENMPPAYMDLSKAAELGFTAGCGMSAAMERIIGIERNGSGNV